MQKKSEPSVCALKMWKKIKELEERAKQESDWNYPERYIVPLYEDYSRD